MSYVYFRESVTGGWDKERAVKRRQERVEGLDTAIFLARIVRVP